MNCGRRRRGQGEAEGWGQVEGGRELGGVGRGGGWHQIFLEGAREREAGLRGIGTEGCRRGRGQWEAK